MDSAQPASQTVSLPFVLTSGVAMVDALCKYSLASMLMRSPVRSVLGIESDWTADAMVR